VRRCLDELAGHGYCRVVTAALLPHEQAGFVEAGFVVEEHLVLLSHDLRALADDTGRRLRKAGLADRPAVLVLDGRSFPPFWQLDAAGLDEAITATPRTRFRVADGGDDTVVAYAITGRAGRRGYIQRLAVDPDIRRAGLGRALVLDGLRWLRRWRAEKVLVNTQEGNEAAAALYETLGFRREPTGLSVLSAQLT
jgi:ribosomal protein S18 acetylase RimI-like enzyme